MTEEAEGRAGNTICVTGASGYIGSFVVKELLERGYHVRATVRDKTDQGKTAHLVELAQLQEGSLELFSADMTKQGAFDEPISGCDYVCHVASVVRLAAKDPQRDIVDPAVNGTRNVLESIRAAGTVKRLVLTSSVAAILDLERPLDHVYTESDWNETVPLRAEPYPLSKSLAERAAWGFVEALPDDERFELVALNPTFVLGPMLHATHARSSPALIRDLVARSFPACPQIYMGIVDIRDVAIAHAVAMELPTAKGRYILHNEALWMQEIAKRLIPHFPEHRIPTRRLPNVLMYAAAIFDKRVSLGWAWRNLGRKLIVDNSKAIRDLGLAYRPVEQTLVDTCRSLIDFGKL